MSRLEDLSLEVEQRQVGQGQPDQMKLGEQKWEHRAGSLNVKKNFGRYFVCFTDDYSRKSWLFVLKRKNEVFNTFVRFKTAVENQTGAKIKTLWTDRGGEYLSNAFKAYCLQESLHRQLTVAYSSYQNGVAEHKHRTLMDRARSMALSCKVPGFLWGETIATANFLVNVSPTVSNNGLTPEERFTGHKPDLSRLRTFGCRAYVHPLGAKLDKLQPRAVRCILVGYDSQSKAYRCYSPDTKKILISNNVVFDETILGDLALANSTDDIM
ncbi:hypothetical protein R1sor_020921 [Riccia sorocarpa]|uniref:Integrase catalytic domain-containing protein n=1 Tax=Riccia sorocarpa TaxID=122646 RepID=A0ABD3GIX2_9MARC